MIQANILEQIKTFFNILVNNQNLLILAIVSIIALVLLIIANKFSNRKITKIICMAVYIGIFGTLIGLYHSEIFKLFDYLINNIFIFLFFPNLAVYALVILIINIIIIKSTFSKKDHQIIRYLNILFFIVFNVIFYLIIDNVIKNNINVYEQLSIYTNNNLLVLVELSMKLFMIWILLLGIVKLSTSLAYTISLHKGLNKNLVLNQEINKDEYANLNTLSNVVEIMPSEILETSSLVNEDLEFVPIKKQQKLSEALNSKLSDNNKLTITDDSKDLKDVEKKEDYKEINYNDSNTLVIEDSYEDHLDALTNSNLSYELNDLKSKPIITLSSYDSIFVENNHELETKVNDNMEVVFNNQNNYMQDIINEIENLKNNKDDKEQLEKIYENIKMNQNDLSLSDYNNLIDALLKVKNA